MTSGGISGCLVCSGDTQHVTEPDNPRASHFFCSKCAGEVDVQMKADAAEAAKRKERASWE